MRQRSVANIGCIFRVYRETRPLNSRQIWWRSLKGFMGDCGVEFQHKFPLTLLVIVTTVLPLPRSLWLVWLLHGN